jgi:hydroxymethylpyrimidine pyrophosphatase-like HAD family hydrolase
MRYAGMSVAMINGDERICRQARFVTAYSHNDDGVARFIERFVQLDG